MGASAGRYGVNIGTAAASGAATGAFAGPWGAAIGGVVGGGIGAISTLLQSSDEAKQKKKALEAYQRQREAEWSAQQAQQIRASQDDYRRRMEALIPGLAQDPMYIAQSYKPYQPQGYDPSQAEAAFNAQMPDEPTPNYGALAQSLGSLGSTVGGLSRQADAAERLGAAKIASSGNPWENYADSSDDPLEKIIEEARRRSPGVTGAW
jgi:hypothetical protein